MHRLGPISNALNGNFVSEQGYLGILHGLNLAKLKLQDNELFDLKAVDPPFIPSPHCTKRGILIIAAGFVGAILVLAIALLMEYFDRTIKTSAGLRNYSACRHWG